MKKNEKTFTSFINNVISESYLTLILWSREMKATALSAALSANVDLAKTSRSGKGTASARTSIESKKAFKAHASSSVKAPNPAFVKSVKDLDKSAPDYYKKLGKIVMHENRDVLKRLADS